MTTVAAAMAEAAAEWRSSLEPAQAGTATFGFDHDAQRRDWHYVPRPRDGLALGQMTGQQRRLASRLVATALSLPAYAKATAIVALEDVLGEVEGSGVRRDSGAYHVTVFGDPGDEAWGWRFEGHHVSLNVTVVRGEVATTPLFLGANPAEVDHRGQTVTRPLAEEEDVARALLVSLPADLRRRAVIDDIAPDDIVTRAVPRVDEVPEGGVAVADLRDTAAELAAALLRLYLERVPLEIIPDPELVTSDLRFAWAGSAERRQPHYYRLAGPELLVEYDNTQDGANHIHTVWRRPGGDFGDDLLRHHLTHDHG